MSQNTDKYQIDMCHGPIFSKIVLFTLPLMATYILQLLFNAVDLVVIGRCASNEAMAAIGATMNMNSLVLNLFIGLSIGSNVIAARYFGAKDQAGMHKAVHTTMAVSIYGGILLTFIALLAAKPILTLMETPKEILPLSCTYIWICFSAIPFIMIYNFGCAILRAVGDTRRPLYYLVIAGTVNVLMNLFFVLVCKMDVGGVAIATALSHAISAILIVITLLRNHGAARLILREMKIDFSTLKEMLKLGIPASLQSSCFAVSNMTIQSSINTFGPLAMAGMTACICLEGICYVGSYSFHQTAISFVAQNLGGHKFKRIRTSLLWCYLCAIIATTIMGYGFLLTGNLCMSLFSTDPEVIRWGIIRMKVLFSTYMLCGIMDVASGGLRGLGYSALSTTFSLFGACILRIWWVLCIFPCHRTMEMLMFSYPVSWAAVAILSSTALFFIYRKTVRTGICRKVEWSKNGPGVPRGLRSLGGAK